MNIVMLQFCLGMDIKYCVSICLKPIYRLKVFRIHQKITESTQQ